MNESTYTQNIIDNYKNPKNYGRLKNPTLSITEINYSCGDHQEIDLIIENDVVKNVKFTGKGCAISQASASLLTEKIKGMKIKEILKFDTESIMELLGINLGPTRLKCALLPLVAIKRALSR